MRRALVLGAGGPFGIAWEAGLVFGLAENGIDVRAADVLIGTSAGSVVAANIAGGLDYEAMFETQMNPELQIRELRPPIDIDQGRRDLAAAKEGGGTTIEILQRVGALARSAQTVSPAERRHVVAARLPTTAWPERDLRVVAVAVESGERVAFDRTSGADFVDAVAASCAVPGIWPPVMIGARTYMDGGVHSTDNADLAEDCNAVLVLALRAESPRLAVVPLEHAVDSLRAGGAWSTSSTPTERRKPCSTR